jgi:hypothetical protein
MDTMDGSSTSARQSSQTSLSLRSSFASRSSSDRGGPSPLTPTAAPSGPLLFEHFLAVGATEQAAVSSGEDMFARRTYSMTDRMRRMFQSASKDTKDGHKDSETAAGQKRRAAYATG